MTRPACPAGRSSVVYELGIPPHGSMLGGMSSTSMVKTSVTVPEADLREAKRLRIDVSALVREALRTRLRDEGLDQEITDYAATFAEWDESSWDHLAGDGLANSS